MPKTREKNYAYRKTKCKQVNVVLSPNDDDIRQKLDSIPKGEKTTYIKQLIREDIRREERL